MKRKVLFSIVGIALFAVAIGFNSQKEEPSDIVVKNIEAIKAQAQEEESLDYAYDCQRCKMAADACYILGSLKGGWVCYL